MIDFACRQIDLPQLIKCGLGLTRAEYQLFSFVLDSSAEYTAQDLADKRKLDLSTVQRTLKKMVGKGLVQRRQVNLGGGGYQYAYQIQERKKIREKLIATIRGWSDKADRELRSW